MNDLFSQILLPNGDIIHLTSYHTAQRMLQEISQNQKCACVSIGDDEDSTLWFECNNVKVLPIYAWDHEDEKIHQHFNNSYVFIKNHLDHGRTVVVHCYAGVSRSPTIVIAYIMRECHLTFEEAFALVKKQRPLIKPNHGFVKQLKTFQQTLETSRFKQKSFS